MKAKHGIHVKKVQRSAGSHYVTISKESVEALKLKAQDEDCVLVELVDPSGQRLVFQVVHKGA